MIWFTSISPRTDLKTRSYQNKAVMTSSSLPFKLVEIPGKGKGLVATNSIGEGETILVETPIFVISKLASAEMITNAVAKLSEVDRAAFFALANSYPEMSPAVGILRTNILPLGATQGGTSPLEHATEGGVFATGSRFNHSCCPNVNHFWDEQLKKEIFRVIKKVETGEELTIYYVNPVADTPTRQLYLSRTFGFQCKCQVCSLPFEERTKSDQRRRSIQTAIDSIPTLTRNPMRAILTGKQALKNLILEGIVVTRGSLCYDMFQVCVAWSDVKNAKSWAAEMAKWYKIERGAETEIYLNAKKYEQNSSLHMAYGTMGRKLVVGGP